MNVDRGEEASPASALLLLDPAVSEGAAIVRILEEHGFVPIVVERWVDLLERLTERGASLVVLDMALAGVAGTRLTGMVRAAWPDAVVVVTSAFEVVDLASLEQGATLVLPPSDLRSFVRLVGQLLGQREPS